jgi:hypothetical protein
MSLPTDHVPDDQVLIRYLLGSATEQEVERLDELSLADDEFALRLSDVENDLIDAYVRRELSAETLERFQSYYLSTAAGRSKVSFAQTWLAYQSGRSASSTPATPVRPWLSTPSLFRQWGVATAAVLLLMIASGYLLVQNTRLRSQVTAARAERTMLEQRAQELRTEQDKQRAANADTAKELARLRESLAKLEERPGNRPAGRTFMLSFVLPPATRGASDVAVIAIPSGTANVGVRLGLESDDFPRYRVALKDAAVDRVVWRSTDLKAAAHGASRIVSITIPASAIESKTYSLDLTGVPARGSAELVGSYPLRVVLR